jgi:exopolysaccharide biosynthesis operon protein EpsL
MAVLVMKVPFAQSALHRTFLAAVLCTASGQSAAQYAAEAAGAAQYPYSLVVGADVSRDSNLFRQPSSARLTADTISMAYVGLRVDKQYSLQRFQLDVTETVRSYAKTKTLDFNSLDYRGAWLWQVGPRLTGTLSADRRESLVPFEDVLNPGTTVRNVRVTENRAFTLDGWAIGDWHLILGANQTSQVSDLAVQIQPDFKAVGSEAGVRYAIASGSSVAGLVRTTSGDYINQSGSALLGTGYRQDEVELRGTWIASGKSTLNGRLTWLTRSQSGASQRNFSGTAGEFSYQWAVSGKLGLNMVAKRDLVPFQDPSGSFITSDTLSIAPTWKITALTVARLNLARTTSKFAGATIGAFVGPQRYDKLTLAEAGIDWHPTNRVVVGASVLRQMRDSTVAAFTFEDTIVRATASYRF